LGQSAALQFPHRSVVSIRSGANNISMEKALLGLLVTFNAISCSSGFEANESMTAPTTSPFNFTGNFTKTTTTATTARAKVPKTCYSVGDPHLKKFDGVAFDSHAVGWKTLYAKGNLKTELEQAKFKNSGVGVAVNRAVRYSTNGGTTWDEMLENGALLSSGAAKTFSNPNVKLTVKMGDFSRFSWAQVTHIYNVYVTTSDYAGATGQCTQGKLRRRLNSDTSDGVTFPSGDAVKVSKEQAEQACAGLTDQKANCVTDLRMVNEPAAVEKITQDFEQVETTVAKLKIVGQPTVDGATTKHFCWSTVALIIGLML